MSLKIEHMGKQFFDDENAVILQDINLEVQPGEFVCIVGPSGCGKSTLLNLIAGLDKSTSGTISHNDVTITGPGADRVVMFQQHALFPWMNVMENVKFGMEAAHLPKKEMEERAKKYLELVELYDYKDYPIHKLSGGMKQRVSLARALALDSDILLMDEPFSALDKQTVNILRDELVKIWETTKRSILFVTHSVEEAVFLADRVVVLSARSKSITKIYNIDIERPRHIENSYFLELRKKILADVKEEARRKEHV